MNITTITDRRTARIALSHLTEPGDSALGRRIAQLGPVQTLHCLALGFDDAGDEDRDLLNRVKPRLLGLRQMDLGLPYEVRAIIPGDPEWIPGLDDLGDRAPLVLYVKGKAGALHGWGDTPSVSIVGSRASTSYGEYVTGEIVGDLASDPRVNHKAKIVSGGAFGIDGAAHRAALAVQGETIAFLAGGVDRMYPTEHQQLGQRIMEHGALVSEMPPGSAPTKWRFLSRNRLIAAATPATVVVEAGWRSGSLNTAGHAHDLGRGLGAVPGPVTSAVSAGPHRLLQEYDAKAITNAADVWSLIGIGE